MGTPVSVTMANLVMEYVETRALEPLPFQLKLYCRYVDDTFVILKRANLFALHEALNSVHPAILITYNIKDNAALFLDILVRRTCQSRVEKTAYRKQCDTGGFLSFYSHHPAEHKWSIVGTFFSHCDAV